MKKTVISIVAAVLMTLSVQARHAASRSQEPLSAAASTGT